jgi:hypothetical protein
MNTLAEILDSFPGAVVTPLFILNEAGSAKRKKSSNEAGPQTGKARQALRSLITLGIALPL